MFGISIAVLLLLGGGAPELTSSSQSTAAKALPAESRITLSDVQPEARVHIPPELGGKTPQILEIHVQRNDNPSSLPFSLAVYLEVPSPAEGSGRPQRVLVANLGFYPADSNGKFATRVSTPFEQLKRLHSDVNSDSVVVLLQLKRVHENKPWQPIRVTISPLRWKFGSAPAAVPNSRRSPQT